MQRRISTPGCIGASASLVMMIIRTYGAVWVEWLCASGRTNGKSPLLAGFASKKETL